MTMKKIEKNKPTSVKRGRPSLFTQEIADSICARLSKGEPLAVICRDEGMPGVQTVSDWKLVHTNFSVGIARAREEGFDAIAAECLEIANTPLEGVETSTKLGITEEKRGDMLGHRKLQIETRLKLLAKWDPKRYGDRLELTGDPERPMQSTLNIGGLSTEALAEIMAAKDATKRS